MPKTTYQDHSNNVYEDREQINNIITFEYDLTVIFTCGFANIGIYMLFPQFLEKDCTFYILPYK